jgi:hypothetical protein
VIDLIGAGEGNRTLVVSLGNGSGVFSDQALTRYPFEIIEKIITAGSRALPLATVSRVPICPEDASLVRRHERRGADGVAGAVHRIEIWAAQRAPVQA